MGAGGNELASWPGRPVDKATPMMARILVCSRRSRDSEDWCGPEIATVPSVLVRSRHATYHNEFTSKVDGSSESRGGDRASPRRL